jgi:hypothetical protein
MLVTLGATKNLVSMQGDALRRREDWKVMELSGVFN